MCVCLNMVCYVRFMLSASALFLFVVESVWKQAVSNVGIDQSNVCCALKIIPIALPYRRPQGGSDVLILQHLWHTDSLNDVMLNWQSWCIACA